MGLFDSLLRMIAGRAEARADLINVGAHGTVRDLPDLLQLLPPLDAFGEAASDAALVILGRASDRELDAWDEASQALVGMRFQRLDVAALEGSRDPATVALASFHRDPTVRAAALRRLEEAPDALSRRLVDRQRARP